MSGAKCWEDGTENGDGVSSLFRRKQKRRRERERRWKREMIAERETNGGDRKCFQVKKTKSREK